MHHYLTGTESQTAATWHTTIIMIHNTCNMTTNNHNSKNMKRPNSSKLIQRETKTRKTSNDMPTKTAVDFKLIVAQTKTKHHSRCWNEESCSEFKSICTATEALELDRTLTC